LNRHRAIPDFIRRELLLAGIKGEDRDRKVERKLPYPLIYMCYRTPTQEVIMTALEGYTGEFLKVTIPHVQMWFLPEKGQFDS